MNQEIKDTLAELTRQADKMETFVVGKHAPIVCPTDSEFLTAQQYRLLVRHVEDLHKVLGDVTTRFEDMAKSFGGRGHSVSICMCADFHAVDKARELLNP